MSDFASLVFRPAADFELGGVRALYAQPEINDGQVLPLDEAARLHRKFVCYPDFVLFVTEHSSHIVGGFALLIMDNLGHLGAPSVIVESVVVDPARQGSGIGRQMMRFAMQRPRQKGCYKLTLSSNARRASAHAFYEGLGFERNGCSFRLKPDRVSA